MDKVIIKLEYLGDGFKELTTFQLEDNSLKFVALEGMDVKTGEYSSLDNHGELYFDDNDLLMVKRYLDICGQDLLETARTINATICFKKEIWLEMQPAIVESWLEKDDCTMLKKSTRVDYCNKILPIFTEDNNFNI